MYVTGVLSMSVLEVMSISITWMVSVPVTGVLPLFGAYISSGTIILKAEDSDLCARYLCSRPLLSARLYLSFVRGDFHVCYKVMSMSITGRVDVFYRGDVHVCSRVMSMVVTGVMVMSISGVMSYLLQE